MIDKDLLSWLIGIGGGIVMIVWGLHGFINKKKINNRTNYVLSIAQIIGGIMALIFPLIYFWHWHGK